jgi:hypothetical protein
MNCQDVADILRGVGFSVRETPVSTEALGLPGGVRVELVVYLDLAQELEREGAREGSRHPRPHELRQYGTLDTQR